MPRLKVILFSVFGLFVVFSSAQETKKKYTVVRTSIAPKIDGDLTDAVWADAAVASGFTQTAPFDKQPSEQRTELRVLYDDLAVYVSLMMYDSAPDSILTQLSERDQSSGNADNIQIGFDTYFTQQNLTIFGTTAANVQFENSLQDPSFDAIWQSEVKITEKGWQAEFKIPYAALRFPDKEEHIWGMQIQRSIRRTRETSLWQYVANDVQNVPAFIGIIDGLNNIKAPLRLFLRPNLTGTASHFPSNIEGKSNWSYQYNAGLDIKYGINESFTLDATLAPDFGQVVSDNRILNISPFEQQFDENRPFFQEEMEIFKQSGNYFYTRRIGQRPSGFFGVQSQLDSTEIIDNNPARTNLLNATKVSGRTNSNLGLGVLNAVTAETFATVVDTSTGESRSVQTAPLTNFNVISLNQTLKNNSSISFMNLNTMRKGVVDDANSSRVDAVIGNKENSFRVSTGGAYSYKNKINDEPFGFASYLNVGKIKGTWLYGFNLVVESDTYNPNDLGLLFAPNEITESVYATYQLFSPKPNIVRTSVTVNQTLSHTYNTKEFQHYQVNVNGFILFKSFDAIFANFTTRPTRFNDFFEPRVPGRKFRDFAWGGGGGGFSSDYRKTFALDVNAGFYSNYTLPLYDFNYSIAPRVRVNDKLSFIYNYNYNFKNDYGFEAVINPDSIIFGNRAVKTYVNTLTGSYIFNNKMSLSLRGRHYWSRVSYSRHFDLQEDGELVLNENYNQNNTQNYNAFNIDLIYRWRFAPGSDMFFVWKNTIETFSRDYEVVQTRDFSSPFANNILNTLESNPQNIFSLKIVYYLDYKIFARKR